MSHTTETEEPIKSEAPIRPIQSYMNINKVIAHAATLLCDPDEYTRNILYPTMMFAPMEKFQVSNGKQQVRKGLDQLVVFAIGTLSRSFVFNALEKVRLREPEYYADSPKSSLTINMNMKLTEILKRMAAIPMTVLSVTIADPHPDVLVDPLDFTVCIMRTQFTVSEFLREISAPGSVTA